MKILILFKFCTHKNRLQYVAYRSTQLLCMINHLKITFLVYTIILIIIQCYFIPQWGSIEKTDTNNTEHVNITKITNYALYVHNWLTAALRGYTRSQSIL